MKKFKVHAKGGRSWDATIEDMGLCFVTRFIIEGEMIYSISPQGASTNERLSNDDDTLEAHGYYTVPESIM